MNKKNRFVISLILKTIVFFSALIGVLMSLGLGRGGFMSGKSALLFFTIQSNIWIALTEAAGAVLLLRKKTPGRAWFVIKFVFTVSITLTGVVFCFVLAPTLGAHAWNLTNILTHVVVPVLSVADFLIIGGLGGLKSSDSLWVVIPPIYYLIFASVGYVAKWNFGGGVNYPYFFMNWGSPAGAFGFCKGLPFMGVVWWVLLLLAFLIGCGLLYIALVRRTDRE